METILPISKSWAENINKIYYCNIDNVGDLLGPYLLHKITGKNFQYADDDSNNKIVTVGSLLTYKVLHTKSLVWGTGLLSPNDLKSIPKIFPLNRAIRQFLSVNRLSKKIQAKIIAVRGKLTQDALSKIGCPCPSIYGDPRILLPRFYTPKKEKIFDIGIILHYSQNDLYKQLNIENNNKVTLISPKCTIEQDIENFINKICSCQALFTTSLHGFILAQAYEIPVQWIQLKAKPIHRNSDFIFFDYFSGVDTPPQKPILFDYNNLDVRDLYDFKFKNFRIKDKTIEDLLNNFPL